MQGSVQHADATGPAVGGPQGGDPVRRDAAVRQPAENDQFSPRTRDGDLPTDRSRQVPGHQAGLSGRQATGRSHSVRRRERPFGGARHAVRAAHDPGREADTEDGQHG